VLLNDGIPRVQSHAAAALTNFLEGLTQDQLQPFLTILLSRFYEILSNKENIYLFENVINALAVTAETANSLFINFYRDFVNLLFIVMGEAKQNQGYEINNLSKNVNKIQKKNDYLKGVIVECLTLIVNGIGRNEAENFLPQLIDDVLSLENEHYFISCLQRLVPLLKETIGENLLKIMPNIVNYINKVIYF
jgi:importin-5